MWVILPLKDLVLAKQRLSGVLSDSERRGLFQAMVEDVLDALTGSEAVTQVVLVSDDPTAPLLAEHYDTLCWSESELCKPAQKGLNATLQAAVAAVIAEGAAAVTVVHGDLPLLQATELDAFIARHSAMPESRKISLNPDAAGAGTNVMAITPPDLLSFEYGSQSAQLHAEQAIEAGAACEFTSFSGMQVDIDDFDDLLALVSVEATSLAPSTRRFLNSTGIADRLRLLADDAGNDAAAHISVLSTVQHFE